MKWKEKNFGTKSVILELGLWEKKEVRSRTSLKTVLWLLKKTLVFVVLVLEDEVINLKLRLE